MFEPIEVSKMQHRKKYKIVGQCEYYGMFICIHKQEFSPIQYLTFVNVLNETNHIYAPSTLFASTSQFYQFVSQKARIQSDMEMRAVNLVVRRIVGDDNFKW